MAKFPAMPIWTDAFIADTTHLSAAQTGALIMLLIIAWRSPDGKLPDDDAVLARYARMGKRTWLANKEIILAGWYQDELQKWCQPRLLDERKNAELNRSQRVQAGRASALKYKNRHSTSVVDPLQRNDNVPKPKPKPISSLRSDIEKKEKIKKRKKSVLAETEKSFDEFWQSYPTNQIPKGSKAKAKQSYLRLIASGVPPAVIAEGSKRYGDYLRQSGAYSKHAVTWLNARGWEDEYVFDNCAGTRVIDGVAYTPTSEYRKKIMAEEAERKAKAEEEAKNEQNRGK